MSNKVDKFFKEKLAGHTLTPSAQAWEKVESHLSKKNKMVLWLRLAAAVALLGMLLFAALNWTDNGKAKTEYAEKVQKPEPEKSAPDSTQPSPKQEEQPVRQQPPLQKQLTTKDPIKKKFGPKGKDLKANEPMQKSEEEQYEVLPELQLANVIAQNTPLQEANSDGQKKEKGIVLTYSLPTIKTKEAEPVVAEVKKTGLERVLEIAKEVKNSDNALGDLRNAKDDIFALGFRKDKDKDKTKKQ